MILILDNLINNYLNILSCFIILSIFNMNKYRFIIIFILDIFLNQIPFISIIILLLYYLNKLIFKCIVKNDINKFIIACFYMIIFLSTMYLSNNYKFSYVYYLRTNIFSIILNITIYYLYMRYYKDLLK